MKNRAQEAQQKIAAAEAAGLTHLPLEVDDEVLAMMDAAKLHKDESYSDVLRRVLGVPKK